MFQQGVFRSNASQTKRVTSVGMLVFLVGVFAGVWISRQINSPYPLLAGALIGAYFLLAIKVVDQWERVAVLRFGRFRALKGPGVFLIIPIVDTLSRYVDQRVRVTTVSAESTLTRDTVPVNVDAIVFWLVWNAEKAIFEVEDFMEAITLGSQTALRESIGRHQLAQMITERETLGHELQKILDEKTTPWGITVQSVEIRDVRIPQALENAMSQQAQADRERQARVILGDAEVQVSDQFAKAAQVYADNPVALHLRGMNMLFEAMREKGSMVVVPSSALDTMGLGGTRRRPRWRNRVKGLGFGIHVLPERNGDSVPCLSRRRCVKRMMLRNRRARAMACALRGKRPGVNGSLAYGADRWKFCQRSHSTSRMRAADYREQSLLPHQAKQRDERADHFDSWNSGASLQPETGGPSTGVRSQSSAGASPRDVVRCSVRTFDVKLLDQDKAELVNESESSEFRRGAHAGALEHNRSKPSNPLN